MAETRRTLTDGIAEIAPPPSPNAAAELSARAEFLHGGASSTGHRAMRTAAMVAGGASLNTRIHPDVLMALRQASLQRKLDGVEPSSLRDIVEEAVTPWLKKYGYLP